MWPSGRAVSAAGCCTQRSTFQRGQSCLTITVRAWAWLLLLFFNIFLQKRNNVFLWYSSDSYAVEFYSERSSKSRIWWVGSCGGNDCTCQAEFMSSISIQITMKNSCPCLSRCMWGAALCQLLPRSAAALGLFACFSLYALLHINKFSFSCILIYSEWQLT